MQAMIRSATPQAGQVSISMLNTVSGAAPE
jgi:hypothetical protein